MTFDHTQRVTFANGRIEALGRWTPPVLPWGSLRKYIENGWARDEQEAAELMAFDQKHAGERGFSVQLCDTLLHKQKAVQSPSALLPDPCLVRMTWRFAADTVKSYLKAHP